MKATCMYALLAAWFENCILFCRLILTYATKGGLQVSGGAGHLTENTHICSIFDKMFATWTDRHGI